MLVDDDETAATPPTWNWPGHLGKTVLLGTQRCKSTLFFGWYIYKVHPTQPAADWQHRWPGFCRASMASGVEQKLPALTCLQASFAPSRLSKRPFLALERHEIRRNLELGNLDHASGCVDEMLPAQFRTGLIDVSQQVGEDSLRLASWQ